MEIVRDDKAINCYYHGGEEEFILFAKVIFNKIMRKIRFSAKSAIVIVWHQLFFLSPFISVQPH